MNIKTPPMPKPVGYTSRSWLANKGGGQFSSIRVVGLELPIHTADQLSARDQQWIEMVRPVVEAAERGLEYAEAELQQRKELYEPYGMERKWATEQRDVDAIRAALSQIKGE